MTLKFPEEAALKQHRNVRGCTYAGNRGDWTAHQYLLTVTRPTRLVLLLSPLAQSKLSFLYSQSLVFRQFLVVFGQFGHLFFRQLKAHF